MALARARMAVKPSRTSSTLVTSRITPPTSVLCRMSGLASLSATGKPIPLAKVAASSAVTASLSGGVGMPYASSTARPSAASRPVPPGSPGRLQQGAGPDLTFPFPPLPFRESGGRGDRSFFPPRPLPQHAKCRHCILREGVSRDFVLPRHLERLHQAGFSHQAGQDGLA